MLLVCTKAQRHRIISRQPKPITNAIVLAVEAWSSAHHSKLNHLPKNQHRAKDRNELKGSLEG